MYKHKPLVNWYTAELHKMREQLRTLNTFRNKYPIFGNMRITKQHAHIWFPHIPALELDVKRITHARIARNIASLLTIKR